MAMLCLCKVFALSARLTNSLATVLALPMADFLILILIHFLTHFLLNCFVKWMVILRWNSLVKISTGFFPFQCSFLVKFHLNPSHFWRFDHCILISMPCLSCHCCCYCNACSSLCHTYFPCTMMAMVLWTLYCCSGNTLKCHPFDPIAPLCLRLCVAIALDA